ncbi:MAG: zinc dependent phospholipase C family protein [Bernardetiaceae bacterium]|jgi:hypothetical protein|nr:zinc dependent phospholipase C family protein [Bernardetiaceae bacterium]
MKKSLRWGLALGLSALAHLPALGWGFFAHQLINRYAVFALPPPMTGFYKRHIRFITENAVNPDKRRYLVQGEAERHYIDIDVYGDSALYQMPRRWEAAVARYTEDTLRAYGIVPWHLHLMKLRLTEAFRVRDAGEVLRLSADLGHYIGDANVPLHTTQNYNGQLTDQIGIHGFWESRLPELFAADYDFFLERARYEAHPLARAWQAVTNAHLALDSVLTFERQLSLRLGDDRKYGYETRNGLTVKVYSAEFSAAYHQMLRGQVERQMRASAQMIADFWYTCWVDAGQPDLDALNEAVNDADELQKQETELQNPDPANAPARKPRPHEGLSFGWRILPRPCCQASGWVKND